jgi:uncharacterized membrane-anchored protein
MNRSQLLGSVFLLMGVFQAAIGIRSLLRVGATTIGAGYLLASALIGSLALVAIFRPAWVDTEDLARERVTIGDVRLVVVTVGALLATVIVGYSFTGWFA